MVHSLSVLGRVEAPVSIPGTSSCKADQSLELGLYAIYRVLLVSSQGLEMGRVEGCSWR